MSARRGNQEGTIRKRADGRWEAMLTIGDGKRKSYYAKTRQGAQRKLAQAQHDIQRGLPIVGDRQTLAQYLDSWFASKKHSIKESTYRRYRTNLRHHIIPALGNVVLTRLTALQIQHLYTQKLDAGLSASTVQNIHTVLHSALKEAALLGLVQRNVADMVRKPARKRTKTSTLSEEQVQIFLKAIKGDRLEALYILALSTGMREGELLGLSWDDVDLEQEILQVTLSLQESDGPVRRILGQPKTAYARRRISLSKAAIWALHRHRERQDMARLRGREVSDSAYDLVFPNMLGRPLHPSHLLRRRFRPLLQRAGLPPIRFHDLRHTTATLLLRRGINPKIVSEMLGHANVRITLDIYSHVTPDMQQRAAQAMDEIFDQRGGGNDDTVD